MISFEKLFDGVKIQEIQNATTDKFFNHPKFDSNKIEKDDVFFCLEGKNIDGHKFACDAAKKGAKAIVCQHSLNISAMQIIVEDTREAFALCCKNYFDKASDKLKIVGVSGTNGKTTTAILIAHILNHAGKNAAVIGTSGAFWNGNNINFNMTTPDPDLLHKFFTQMLEDGVEYVVMEVSAHAIALKKIAGIIFEVGVMTNITEDHLDYFDTFQKYAKTKVDFMNSPYVLSRVVNVDDEILRNNMQENNLAKITYGMDCPADCFVAGLSMSAKGSHFVLNFMDNVVEINSPLVGKYNIENIMAAFCACSMLGVPFEETKDAIASFAGVEGRFNVYSSTRGFDVVIDYAHTPDGLQNVLKTASGLTSGRLILVFGCGGGRERQKRPQMARIAEKYCDDVIVTSDNPRFENPQDIIDEIKTGFEGNNHIEIVDRFEAIKHAMKIARPHDIVLVCGKGAEDYMEIKGEKIHFKDAEVVKQFL